MVRELYSLAQVIDCLRAGHLSQAADGLAARFIAVHQALEDGNWSAASALELFTLEAPTSASTSTLLMAQKHNRLLAKSQGWSSGYKGRGSSYKGGGGWGGYYENNKGETGRGKGKKGKYPKGKQGQKSKYAKGDKPANPWAENKDEKKGSEAAA